MSERDESQHRSIEDEVRSLDPGSRGVLAVLAVCGRASLSADELGEVAEVPDVRPVLAELERRGLLIRDGDRYSLAQPAQGRLKRLLASVDVCDRVLRAFIGIAEDGRLSPADLDAVVELTGIAAQLGRWKFLLRLAEAAETTLSMAHRVEEWVAIVERHRDAARALGDDGAVSSADRELARLRASAREGVGRGSRIARSVLAAAAAGAVGVAAGYVIGDQSSGEAAKTVTGASSAVTETGTATTTTVTVVSTTTVTAEAPEPTPARPLSTTP